MRVPIVFWRGVDQRSNLMNRDKNFMNWVITMWQQAFTMTGLAISLVLVSLLPLREGYCVDLPVPLRAEAVRPGAESGPTRVSVGVTHEKKQYRDLEKEAQGTFARD